MSIGTILLVFVVMMLVGFLPFLPVWRYASGWGYGPSGTVGAALLVIVVLFLLMGRL